MATFSQNQVLDIFVVEVLATETNVKDFIDHASPLELQILAIDGAHQPTMEDFYFVQKHKDGSFKRSDVIPVNQIRFINPISPKVTVPKSYVFTVSTTGTSVGDVFIVTIKIDNWGSKSFEDQYLKFGFHKRVTGDNAVTIAAGLAASLTLNSTRDPESLFTYVALGPTLTITEVLQDYVTGKKQGLPLEFTIENSWGATPVITNRVINPCSGRHVRDLEYFCKGNVGDSLRYANYPHNWEEWYDSELSDYCLVHIGYYYKGTGVFPQTSEKEIIVAFLYCDDGCDLVEILEQATGFTIECPNATTTLESTVETTVETTLEVTTTCDPGGVPISVASSITGSRGDPTIEFNDSWEDACIALENANGQGWVINWFTAGVIFGEGQPIWTSGRTCELLQGYYMVGDDGLVIYYFVDGVITYTLDCNNPPTTTIEGPTTTEGPITILCRTTSLYSLWRYS
jgi:hypothetical protein